ncbi:hypothetical protein WMW72_00675 [Paenibacillus filicis]|uniref:Uncharacterized protein n=1 Tax=Paenibacillus filicis TaxID=669464 RepID=A0ABU9DDT1_9BACL
MAVVVQYYQQAHWFGILQPVALTLCYWLIFKFRPFPALLVVLSAFASGGISEVLINWMITGFHLEQAIAIQLTDSSTTALILIFYHTALYFLLHKLRLSFTFKAPSPFLTSAQRKYSGAWRYLATGFVLLHFFMTYALYQYKPLLVPALILCVLIWSVLLFLSYLREMED